jgi:hypothetical protein
VAAELFGQHVADLFFDLFEVGYFFAAFTHSLKL